MASACLNTIGLSPETLPECSQKYSPYSWFRPRLSISREMTGKNVSDLPDVSDPAKEVSDLNNDSDTTSFDGFEFRLEDPALMLPADQLFSDGKLIPLVPLQFSVNQPESATSATTDLSGVDYTSRKVDETDPYYSPRAPRCSSRWKELLGLRKLHQSSNNNNHTVKPDNKRTTSFTSSQSHNANSTRSIRQLLYRNSKSTNNDSPINLPLLKDTDNESVSISISSRPSLSSSSSSHDNIDDLPRLSLDSDKPSKLHMNINPNPSNRTKTRMMKTKTTQSTDTRVGRSTRRRSTETALVTNRCLSVDSPRINSCGKIVFHSLERSSSSPSSLIGGSRTKYRGMERSYSGNVRITPVLNVPVCSLRGSSKTGGVFGFQMFSGQKQREGCSSGNSGGSNRSQRFSVKNC